MSWFLTIWNKVDGRKTAIGIVMIVGGYIAMQLPQVEVVQFGVYLFNTGIGMAGLGALHKVKKGA